ncbi:putative glycosyltransferase, forming alpha glycosyl linkages protein [Synechococcus sp. WH 5701]|nr:glycosyltransferase [Synechococcus sp. CCFWC 502]EAQ74115.1 putative glycosyltransferase, forming alpha glycosyl linkages protein [Synechococcus sp. WH 5701]WFN58381.1 glycosyltransferase [Synechococcus sp. CCFWC 502]
MTTDSYDLVILSLFHPKVVSGGAQQCAYDLFLNLKKYSDLRVCFIGATSPETSLNTKASAFIRKVPGAEDEFYFFTGSYDYFWHNCVDSRGIKDLTLFIQNLQPRSVFLSHYMHIGMDLIALLRFALPEVFIAVGLHEMLFACLADGQMVKKTNGGLCSSAEPELCAMCFPHLSADTFMARKKHNLELMDMADSFIVPARHLGSVLQKEMGIDGQRIHVINHPIDLERYPAEPPTPMPFSVGEQEKMHTPMRFGYFGQFLDNKGIHILLKAGELLNRSKPERPFQIVINGGNKNFASGPFQEMVQELIDNSRQWEHGEVIELGGYSHDEIVRRMVGVDVVVVPSTWPEVFGLVVTEAFACYKPVIAALIGGLAERVQHGVDGYNFIARDPSDLTAKMALFLEMGQGRYNQMAEAAHATAEGLNPKRALAEYGVALALGGQA